MEQFHKNNNQERIDFITCPDCGNKIRADRANNENHSVGCSWRLKTNSRPGYDPMFRKIKQMLDEEEGFSRRIKDRIEKVHAEIEEGKITKQDKLTPQENPPVQEKKKKIRRPKTLRNSAIIPDIKRKVPRNSALIPSSWGRPEEKTDKVRSVIKTPFESNRRKH